MKGKSVEGGPTDGRRKEESETSGRVDTGDENIGVEKGGRPEV